MARIEKETIIKVLMRIKNEDEFYFKNYCDEIIETFADQQTLDFGIWLSKNTSIVKSGDKNYLHNGKLKSAAECFVSFKRENKS